MRLIYVPTDDARRELQAIRSGRTEKEYIAYIWRMRNKAHGPVRKPSRSWPFIRLASTSNVTQLPTKKGKQTLSPVPPRRAES